MKYSVRFFNESGAFLLRQLFDWKRKRNKKTKGTKLLLQTKNCFLTIFLIFLECKLICCFFVKSVLGRRKHLHYQNY